MNTKLLQLFSLTAAVCLTFSGCSSSDQPELGQVNGVVTFDGAPLVGAVVTFMPTSGRPASGTTDENGSYVLTYIRDTEGTKVGTNKVSISMGEGAENEMELEGDDADQSQLKDRLAAIPEKYNTKTELVAQVEPGENTFDFHLEK
ncbi:carboxypeptidase-like regulatory domain-containing protein [Rubinisphaera brasiliensis]|uniref:Carboxypeptidase regulatory-like domain-containing protein n=1 Tax=Rubinisphaera brasiliensis (strain ATCC 49424 / DSM 5305 / JCM 21570 / IAM 15109 / NBRC 103401 / IFAM 1448) TaxID=756272 RepID=F0SH16_RUBBR|nr:carboxypeptidase-like regulatory domain-containing protein [Rubinisphaera brasiliensis]ADY59501.1 hypothetical protein Plabr_1892 [Rubinisphaera brasiliensis DSM 5305]